MRAYLYNRYGPPDVVHETEVPAPVPRPGEIRIAVHAAALNPVDTGLRSGAYRFLPMSKVPTIFGHDAAGVVESTGPGVSHYAIGDRVFGFARPMTGGALADFVTLPAADAARIPDNLPFEYAASVPLCATTAIQALRGLRRNTRVLVNGASGGVGTFAVQIAAALGARVTGVCSWKNAGMVTSLGAAEVRDYLREPVLRRGDAFDVIFDVQSCLSPGQLPGSLAPRGRYVDTRFSVARSLVGLFAALKGKRFSNVVVKPSGKDLEAVARMMAAGDVKPVVEQVYTIDRLREAQEHLESGHARGKLVVRWPAAVAP